MVLLPPMVTKNEPGVTPLNVWDIATGKVAMDLEAPFPDASKPRPNWPCHFIVSANASVAASEANCSSVVIAYSLDSGKILHRFSWPPAMLHGRRHADGAASLALSRDGRYLAIGGLFGELYIYDVHTGEKLRTMASSPVWKEVKVAAVAFSPDAKFVATTVPCVKLRETKRFRSYEFVDGLCGNLVNVWRLHDGKLIASYPPSTMGEPLHLSWSPKGKYLAIVAADKTVRIWSLRNPNDPGVVMNFKNKGVTRAAFSPNGEYLAVLSRNLLIFHTP